MALDTHNALSYTYKVTFTADKTHCNILLDDKHLAFSFSFYTLLCLQFSSSELKSFKTTCSIDDRLYSAILRSLEQTHCAHM